MRNMWETHKENLLCSQTGPHCFSSQGFVPFLVLGSFLKKYCYAKGGNGVTLAACIS